ncbi:MAG: argininosuccinate lyase [Alphaproteobacteria bacterium]|nr:argininosuccinate lyase [Alphaproteobacteria bacterium]
MKLWQKSIPTFKDVEFFTQGKDIDMDSYLFKYDILGSLAHIKMLQSINILTTDEWQEISNALKNIFKDIEEHKVTFCLINDYEDIHSFIELKLTELIGESAKKMHTARSRNDQVLLDIKLFLRTEIKLLVEHIHQLFNLWIQLSHQHQHVFMPGYTHFQLAMPSSFGLWFGSYAESLLDDMIPLKAAYHLVNKNPLGSAAGYGSSFPINRQLTTLLLGFDDLNYNAINAQTNRGKVERIVVSALSNLAETLARCSNDCCTFLNQHFNFIGFPQELTTGSSIMPHKKNPDVFELVRAYCNRIKALPNELFMITTNLQLGYNRDLQIIKEHVFPCFQTMHSCIDMLQLMFNNIQINPNINSTQDYSSLFTVEKINELVLTGMPFRTAYQKVSEMIENKSFSYHKTTNHTHEGSTGNLCNEQIVKNMLALINSFNFNAWIEKENNLVS